MPFKELNGSPKESFNSGGASIRRSFIGPWNERLEFAEELAATPAYPAYPLAILSSIDFEPHSGKQNPDQEALDIINDVSAYEEVRCDAIYSLNPENASSAAGGGGGGGGAFSEQQSDGTQLLYEVNGEVEVRTIKGKGLKWGDRDNADMERRLPTPSDLFNTLIIPIGEHVIEWKNVPQPDWGILQFLKGTVNDRFFIMPVTQVTYSPETLLFQKYSSGVDFDFSSFTNPRFAWRIRHVLLERAVDSTKVSEAINGQSGEMAGPEPVDGTAGWNHYYRDQADPEQTAFTEGWYRLKTKSDSTEVGYQRRDFGTLFRQG